MRFQRRRGRQRIVGRDGSAIMAAFKAETAVRPPTINGAVAALRFFFSVTLDRPEMTRHLTSSRAGLRSC